MKGDKNKVVPEKIWMDFQLWHHKWVFFLFYFKFVFWKYQSMPNKFRLELIYTLLVYYNRFLHNIGTAKRARVIRMAGYVINSTCTSTFLIFVVRQWKRRWHCRRHSQAWFTAGIFQLREQLSASLVRLKWGSRRVWDSHGSIDLPWPQLSWWRPPSATGKGELDYK